MKLLPDTNIKPWLAAKVETGAGEEEKEMGPRGTKQGERTLPYFPLSPLDCGRLLKQNKTKLNKILL